MSPPQAAPVVHHQVLVVDDDDDLREAMGVFLAAEGFDVAPAWGVEDAYRHLRQGFRPCVVLLDLHMPGMNGFAFLDRMRIEPHLVDVPVVVVSGDDTEKFRARQAGCDFVVKPVRPERLLEAIARHCRRHFPPS